MSYACLACKTAHKRAAHGCNSGFPLEMECPNCQGAMYNLGRHFKAPKKSDTEQWKKVAFLIDHGFFFQKIRPDSNGNESVPYPKTLDEAKEFVVKYNKWSAKNAT